MMLGAVHGNGGVRHHQLENVQWTGRGRKVQDMSKGVQGLSPMTEITHVVPLWTTYWGWVFFATIDTLSGDFLSPIDQGIAAKTTIIPGFQLRLIAGGICHNNTPMKDRIS